MHYTLKVIYEEFVGTLDSVSAHQNEENEFLMRNLRILSIKEKEGSELLAENSFSSLLTKCIKHREIGNLHIIENDKSIISPRCLLVYNIYLQNQRNIS